MDTIEGAAEAVKVGKLQALKEAAKHLVSLGYGVIQTGGGGDPKRPLKRNWNRDIATTPEALEGWEWPSVEWAGIAIVPFGRVVALDLDAPNKDEKRPSPEVDLYYHNILSRFPELAYIVASGSTEDRKKAPLPFLGVLKHKKRPQRPTSSIGSVMTPLRPQPHLKSPCGLTGCQWRGSNAVRSCV